MEKRKRVELFRFLHALIPGTGDSANPAPPMIENLVFRRRAVLGLPEDPVEGGNRCKARLHGYVRDRKMRVQKKRFRGLHAPLVQVIVVGLPGELLEQP